MGYLKGYAMTTKSKELAVVAVEYADEIIDVGAEACKAMPPGRRYRYARKHTLILTDGTRVDGEVHAETKPKLAKRIESEKEYVKLGCIFCKQGYGPGGPGGLGGPYWYTITRVSISLR